MSNLISFPTAQFNQLLTAIRNSGGGGGGSSEVVYSTEEQMIGKWIDNKPLYQKTYQIDLNSENFSFNLDIDFEYINYDIVTNNSNYVLKDTFNNSSDRLFCYIYVPSKTFSIVTNSYYLGNCYVTIQYTKTTD